MIKDLFNQLMPQDNSGFTLLKLYRLGSQTNLKKNQTRLLKVVLESLNEKDLIIQNGQILKGSEIFVRKHLPLADRTKDEKPKKN